MGQVADYRPADAHLLRFFYHQVYGEDGDHRAEGAVSLNQQGGRRFLFHPDVGLGVHHSLVNIFHVPRNPQYPVRIHRPQVGPYQCSGLGGGVLRGHARPDKYFCGELTERSPGYADFFLCHSASFSLFMDAFPTHTGAAKSVDALKIALFFRFVNVATLAVVI